MRVCVCERESTGSEAPPQPPRAPTHGAGRAGAAPGTLQEPGGYLGCVWALGGSILASGRDMLARVGPQGGRLRGQLRSQGPLVAGVREQQRWPHWVRGAA